MDPLVPLSYLDLFIANTTPRYSLIWVVVILVICSAFFSAVETALTCANRVRLKLKAEDGSHSAKLALRLINKYDQSLISLLIGNNVVNILASSLVTLITLSAIQDDTIATIVATVIVTIIIFIFGETIPKNIAKANPDKTAQILCYPLSVIYVLIFPIMQIFNFILWLFKVSFKITDDENTLTEDEFQDIIVNTEEEGIIDEEESDIIQAAVEFNDITVKDVYTPKEKIVSLDYSKLTKNQLLKQVNNIKYTRIPIYLFDKDNIIGILNTRKLLKVAMSSKKFTIKQALSEVIKVKDTAEISDVIEIFKAKKCHLAIVTDQDDKLVGLVTMEDILEELVGETIKGGAK